VDGEAIARRLQAYWTEPSPNYYEETSRRVAVYDVTATATQGTAGAADYVERQIQVRIEHCKDPNAASPAYVCQ